MVENAKGFANTKVFFDKVKEKTGKTPRGKEAPDTNKFKQTK